MKAYIKKVAYKKVHRIKIFCAWKHDKSLEIIHHKNLYKDTYCKNSTIFQNNPKELHGRANLQQPITQVKPCHAEKQVFVRVRLVLVRS